MADLVYVVIIEGGKLVSGADVEILDSSNNVVAQGHTNSNGEFSTQLFATGNYKAEGKILKIDGLYKGSKSFSFVLGEDSNVTVELEKV